VSTERRAPLDRKRVADTALKLLNEGGLEGLTVRAIAKELDVKAPALYWHFKDKQALLDEMATEMYRRMTEAAPVDPDATWQERLLAANRALRAALLSYRDGARVFSGSRFTGTLHAVEMEQTLRLLTGSAARDMTWTTAPAGWPTSLCRPRRARRSSRTTTGTSKKGWPW
jgi:AcrR family transcriptional regulator